MGGEKKYLSIAEIDEFIDTQYLDVHVFGGDLRFGSLDAGTMLDFIELNEQGGTAKREAGLRLIAQSLVDGDGVRTGVDDKGLALPKVQGMFRRKDARTVTKLVEAILKLNGLDKKVKVTADTEKNDSGEAPLDVSPTD